MTDGPRSSADDSPEITEVRRVLADSRHTEPMPDDVAARMDRVLAGLRGTEAGAPVEPVGAREAEVVPIAAHRRRRALGLLVAAAVVVVGGFAVAQNLPSPGQSGGSATSAAEDAPHPDSLDNGQVPHTGKQQRTPSASPGGKTSFLRDGRVVVRRGHFSVDALNGRSLLDNVTAQSFARACADLTRHARAVPAEYRHAPAVLVFRRPEGPSQVVDLFLCGIPQPVRSATLPAP